MKDIYDHVDQWIRRISKVQNYGHSICPYAKKAKYIIFNNEDKVSLQIKACNFDNNFDLYICLPTNQNMSVEDAQRIEDDCNRVAKNTITLLDHYKNPGYIDGISTGNGKYVIFLIQNKKDLLAARKKLKLTNYYSNWSDEYYKKITDTGI